MLASCIKHCNSLSLSLSSGQARASISSLEARPTQRLRERIQYDSGAEEAWRRCERID